MIPATARVHLALLLTVMVWGVNLTAVKLLTPVLDATLIALLRMALAAAVLWGLLRWRETVRQPWSGAEWVGGLAVAALMVYAQQMLFATGMARTTATNAALVMALAPFVNLMAETLVFRKPLVPRQLAGAMLAMAGVALVILNRPQAQWTRAGLGDLLILLSVFTFATGGVIIQRMMRGRSMLSVSAFSHVAGSAMLVVHASVFVPGAVGVVLGLPWWGWALVAFSGVFSTALGAVAWARGIQVLGVGRTASYLAGVPVFGVAFAALALKEPLSPWHFVGGAAVLAGSALALRAGARLPAPAVARS